jgi:UDP-glucose 4-epimerase
VTATVHVVGGGGLIGSALLARLATDGVPAAHLRVPDWQDPAGVREAFDALAATLRDGLTAGARGPWTVVWSAGRAVIPSPDAAHRAEVAAFDALLGALGRRLGGRDGSVLLVSSAGGVYAGGDGSPFDERTPPAPRSAYGRGKVDQELLLAEAAVRHGWQARVARVANVYGPGQDPLKPQGLVTRLCRAAVLGEEVRLYVPPATSRHYLHADDAARLLARLLALPATGPGLPILRVVTAGPALTVADLVAAVATAAGHDLPVRWETDASASDHAVALPLATRDPGMVLADPVPLAEGVAALLAEMRAGAGHDAADGVGAGATR